MKSLLTLTLFLALCTPALAEDRALIVGISAYAKWLPGPDKDVGLMLQVMERLGFKAGQIKQLVDKEATQQGIVAALQEWLIGGTKPGDRAVLYFSGHGTQMRDLNGDEDDGCDEAIVPYDTKLISDDDLDRLLQQIPASEVMVILDSCFSGTATKGLFDEPEGKLWPKAATTPTCRQPVNVKSLALDSKTLSNRITLSAASQNEVALGALRPGEGSAFTQNLFRLLAASSGPLTFRQLRDRSAEAIRQTVNPYSRLLPHTPQIEGPPEWLSKNFFAFGKLDQPEVTAQPYTGGVENASTPTDLFARILNASQFRVEIAANKEGSYKLGEEIKFQVFTSKGGYLNLVELGADGKLTVIFPNQFNKNNRVEEGEMIAVPGARVGSFVLRGVEPLGKSRILALVTAQPVNLLEGNLGSIIGQFKSLEFDSALKTTLSRSVGVFAPEAERTAPVKGEHGAALVVIEVK
jgi:hypothetical protein